jgi:hypothetical protein
VSGPVAQANSPNDIPTSVKNLVTAWWNMRRVSWNDCSGV